VGLRDVAAYVAATWDRVPLVERVPLSVAGSHAGEFETSMMLAARPGLVRLDRAEAGDPRPLEAILDLMIREGIQAVSANGVLGDQRAGDAARGLRYLDALADYLAADVRRYLENST
jgi:creatinine amidohydrolase